LRPLGAGAARVVDGQVRDELWRSAAEIGHSYEKDTAAVMTWGVLPTQLVDVMEGGAAIAARNGLHAALTAHAGVGIVTAVLASAGAHANALVATLTEWRGLVNGVGGHARVEWAPLAVKERVSVWDESRPSVRIMKSIKERLDPRGTLNPGRFVGDI
jgi:FAD/FMN-containing dehydrogenase